MGGRATVGHDRLLHLGGRRPCGPLSQKAWPGARIRPSEFNQKWAKNYKLRGFREEVQGHEAATCHPGEKSLCAKSRLTAAPRPWGQQGEEQERAAGAQGGAGGAAGSAAPLLLQAATEGQQRQAQGAVARVAVRSPGRPAVAAGGRAVAACHGVPHRHRRRRQQGGAAS